MRTSKSVVLLIALAGVAAVVATGALAWPAGKTATTVSGALLSSYQEVPSVSNPAGSGQIELTLLNSQTIGFRMRWSGLTGPPAAAHIHFGQRGVNGGVAAFLCGGSTKPACPQAAGGTIEGTIVPADVIGPGGQGISSGEFGELTQAMTAGFTYANIHTQLYPGGELRGQISI